MHWPEEPNDPPWRRRARAFEFWAMAAFLTGSLAYGLASAIAGLLR